MGQNISDEDAIQAICAKDKRYDPDAYRFVGEALAFTAKMLERPRTGPGRHIKGRELLDATAVKLRDEGLHNIKTVLREGDASHEIIALAVEERADLIVMATHRYSHTGKLFMGSVIDRVTKKSPCPILWVF